VYSTHAAVAVAVAAASRRNSFGKKSLEAFILMKTQK
jgi:hypothetical protein